MDNSIRKTRSRNSRRSSRAARRFWDARSQRRGEAAIHEAGHAVVAVLLEHTFLDVLLFDEPRFHIWGQLFDDEPETREEMERKIVVSFAGAAAELLAGHPKRRVEAGAANDEHIAANWLTRLGDGADERELRARAARLVEDHRSAVESVAAQLLQRGNLDYEAVSRIVGKQ